ncbi:hypothetical protein GGI35DRAFT_407967 [Trichoderma velutinum]
MYSRRMSLENQIAAEPMSQRPAAFEMQPATPRLCCSPYTGRPFVHVSLHPSIQLILCCLSFILAKVLVPLKFGTNYSCSTARCIPAHMNGFVINTHSQLPALSSMESSLCSLKANRLILHGRIFFLLHSSQHPPPRLPAPQRISLITSLLTGLRHRARR